jgi:hypothetical protein
MDTPDIPDDNDPAAAAPTNIVAFARPTPSSTPAADNDDGNDKSIMDVDDLISAFTAVKDQVISASIVYENDAGGISHMYSPQTTQQLIVKQFVFSADVTSIVKEINQ